MKEKKENLKERSFWWYILGLGISALSYYVSAEAEDMYLPFVFLVVCVICALFSIFLNSPHGIQKGVKITSIVFCITFLFLIFVFGLVGNYDDFSINSFSREALEAFTLSIISLPVSASVYYIFKKFMIIFNNI